MNIWTALNKQEDAIEALRGLFGRLPHDLVVKFHTDSPLWMSTSACPQPMMITFWLDHDGATATAEDAKALGRLLGGKWIRVEDTARENLPTWTYEGEIEADRFSFRVRIMHAMPREALEPQALVFS